LLWGDEHDITCSFSEYILSHCSRLHYSGCVYTCVPSGNLRCQRSLRPSVSKCFDHVRIKEQRNIINVAWWNDEI